MKYEYVSEHFDKMINGKWVKSWCDKEPDAGKSLRVCHKSLSAGRWTRIIDRCKPGGEFQKDHPTYLGARNLFKDYQSFVEWSRSEIGYDNEDSNGRSWCLDKDFLVDGNKVYSEDTCIFVPNRANYFLTTSGAIRGDFPIGVSYNKLKAIYESYCSDDGNLYLGSFSDPLEAHRAWQKCKIGIGLEMAREYNYHHKLYDSLTRKMQAIQDDYNNYRETFSI